MVRRHRTDAVAPDQDSSPLQTARSCKLQIRSWLTAPLVMAGSKQTNIIIASLICCFFHSNGAQKVSEQIFRHNPERGGVYCYFILFYRSTSLVQIQAVRLASWKCYCLVDFAFSSR